MGQFISYYYISGKLEHIYPEKQQSDSVEDNGPKYLEGVIQGKEMLDKALYIEWACQTLPFCVQHQWQTVEYCHRKYASDEVSITNAVYWWMDEGTQYL